MAHEKTIGDITYSVVELPAMRALLIQPLLAPIFVELAGAFAKAVQSVAKASGDDDLSMSTLLNIDVDAIMPALSRAATKISPADLEHLTRQLLAGAQMQVEGKWIPLLGSDGTGGAFDLKMKRRLADVWRLLVFALEVNYPDFFDALGGLGARLRAASVSAK